MSSVSRTNCSGVSWSRPAVACSCVDSADSSPAMAARPARSGWARISASCSSLRRGRDDVDHRVVQRRDRSRTGVDPRPAGNPRRVLEHRADGRRERVAVELVELGEVHRAQRYPWTAHGVSAGSAHRSARHREDGNSADPPVTHDPCRGARGPSGASGRESSSPAAPASWWTATETAPTRRCSTCPASSGLPTATVTATRSDSAPGVTYTHGDRARSATSSPTSPPLPERSRRARSATAATIAGALVIGDPSADALAVLGAAGARRRDRRAGADGAPCPRSRSSAGRAMSSRGRRARRRAARAASARALRLREGRRAQRDGARGVRRRGAARSVAQESVRVGARRGLWPAGGRGDAGRGDTDRRRRRAGRGRLATPRASAYRRHAARVLAARALARAREELAAWT